MQFELNHLKYFYMTVVHEGVMKAADRLNVSQSVVSKMLSNLEANLQEPLFYKKGRKKELTDYGQYVFRKCQVIFGELDSLNQTSSFEPNILTIGATDLVANNFLFPKLNLIKKQFQNTHFNVYTSPLSHLVNEILGKNIDLAFSFYRPNLPNEIEVRNLETYRYHLVVKKGLQNDKTVMENFIGSREVNDRSTNSFPTLKYHRKKWPKAKIGFSSNCINLHKELVLNGEGISILPYDVVKKELKSERLIDIYPKKVFEWPLKAIYLKSNSLVAQIFEKNTFKL